MTIEFRCPTVSSYDPASQKYLTCDQPLKADDDAAGGLMECPRCGEYVSIPNKVVSSTAAKISRAEKEQQILSRTLGASSPSEQDEAGEVDVMSEELPQTATKLRQTPRSHRPCRICKTPIPPGATDCPKCGAARKSEMGAELDLEKFKVQPAGFQLSLSKSFTRGFSGSHIGIGLGSLLLVVSCLFLAIGAVASPLTLVAIVPFLLVAWMLLVYFWMNGQRVAREPAADLGAFQRTCWNAFAFFCSSVDWSLRGKVPREERLHLRGPQHNDTSLLTDSRITHVHLIDLRDSSITDEGLRLLRGCNRLKYLRLNRTNVSTEAVFRLQQTIPKCWIWW